jgi:hypothetical protein
LQSQTTGQEIKNGAVAQSVEQRTENPCVAGSIPAHTTSKSFREIWSFLVLYAFYHSCDAGKSGINKHKKGYQ